MSKIFVKYSLLILATLTFWACEQKTDWQLQSESSNKLVVDALITNEYKQQLISVTKTIEEYNGKTIPVSGVKFILYENERSYLFTESADLPGNYYSGFFQAVVGAEYVLVMEYKGFKDTAVAKMEGVTPLEELVYTKNDSGYYKIQPTNSEGSAMLELYYDWSEVPEYCRAYGNCIASQTYYTINYIEIMKEFAPKKKEIVFPPGTTVVQRKYSLSDAHQAFIRSLLIETEWRGGLFDVEQGNVKSNFRNGTLGFFATCMMLSDTTYID